jgi:hypothetical protein
MSTKRPVTRIDKGGKPGRPAEVRNVATREIAAVILDRLVAEGIIAPKVALAGLRPALDRLAVAVLQALRERRDLHVVPGRIMRELALLAGEIAPHEPPAQTPTEFENSDKGEEG